MNPNRDINDKIEKEGFAIVNNIFSEAEIGHLLKEISQADSTRASFRKSKDLFAVRQFFKEVPSSVGIVFNDKLNSLIAQYFGTGYFVVKSIYFDKPEESNWFVSWHQDLTISVDKRIEFGGFGPWTIKQNQFAVQPPLNILQDNFTIRIHIDKTNEENGALKVLPGSHLKGITRPETIDWTMAKEKTCCVDKGSIMIMKPLLLHSSGRTTNKSQRRVIHIEFSRSSLPENLNWSERIENKAFY